MLISIWGSAQEKYALANMSVVCVRENPSHSAELGSQVLMGLPVKLVERVGDWWHVKTIEGYDGYIIHHSLSPLTTAEFEQWRSSQRVIYLGPEQSTLWADRDMNTPVSDIVPGVILEVVNRQADMLTLRLPDGRIGHSTNNDYMSLEEWSVQDYNPHEIANYARRHIGVPYLWGGTSSKAMDCSGLCWVAYWLNGRLLPRNANDQKFLGQKVSPDKSLIEGNLVFFGNRNNMRANHVAIALNDTTIIESSGRVKVSPLSRNHDGKKQGYLFGVDLSTIEPVGKFHNWLFNSSSDNK